MKVLLVESDPNFSTMLEEYFSVEGCETETVVAGRTIISRVQKFQPDAIVINNKLPDTTGFEILKLLKSHEFFKDIPVFMTSDDQNKDEIIEAFDLGADDYLVKPFLAGVLHRKIKVSLARLKKPSNPFGIEINTSNYTAFVHGVRLSLTPTEFKILNVLVYHCKEIVLRTDLERQIFDERTLTKRNLDVHIHHLRQKIRPYDLTIANTRGLGYRLDRLDRKPSRFEIDQKI